MTRPLPATFRPEHTVLDWRTSIDGRWASYVIPGASAAMADKDGFQRYFGYPERCRFAVMHHEAGHVDSYIEGFPTLEEAISYTEWLVLWRARMTRLPWQDWLRQVRQCGHQEHGGGE